MVVIIFYILFLVTRFGLVEGTNFVECGIVKHNKVKSKSKFWYKITVELNIEKTNVLYVSDKVTDVDIRDELYKKAKKTYPKSGSYYCDYSIEKDKVLEIISYEQFSERDAEKDSSDDVETNQVEEDKSIEFTDVEKETRPDPSRRPSPEKILDKQEKSEKDYSSEEKSKIGEEFTETVKEAKPIPEPIKERREAEEVSTEFEREGTSVDDQNDSETASDEKQNEYSGKSEVERIKEVLQEREGERKEELEGTVNRRLEEIFQKKRSENQKKTKEVSENFMKTFFKNFHLRFTEVRWFVLFWVVFKFLFALAAIAGFALALRIVLITRYRPTPPLIRRMTASELHELIVQKIENYRIPKIKPIESGYDRTMSDFFDKHEYDRYITKKVPSNRIEELILLKFMLEDDGKVLKELFPETPYLLTFDTLAESFKEHKRTFPEFTQLMEQEIDSRNASVEEEKNDDFGLGTTLFCVLWNGKSVFTDRSTYFHVVKLEYEGSKSSREKMLEEQDVVVSHNPFHSKSNSLSFSTKEKEEYRQKKIRRKKNRIAEYVERFLAEMGMYISFLSKVKDPIQVDIITNHDVRSLDYSGGPDEVDDYQEYRYELLGVEKFQNRSKKSEVKQSLSTNIFFDSMGRSGRPEIWGSKNFGESRSQSSDLSENLSFSRIENECQYYEEEEEDEEEYLSSSFNSDVSTVSNSDSLLSITSDEGGEGGLTRQRRDSFDETLQLEQEMEGEGEEEEMLKKKLQEMVERGDI